MGTSAQAYLRVLIGVAIGIIFLGEKPNLLTWIGLGFIIIGVIAMV